MASSKIDNLYRLPGWVTVWFFTTAIICTYDATFIILRPLTLPGGPLSFIWHTYQYYYVLDKRYQDTTDAFVICQSLLNYAEVILNVITLVMHYKNSRHTRLMAFTVTVMTFWKTVLYFLMFSEYCGGDSYRTGNSPVSEFFLVVIPNGFWILLPFMTMVHLWSGLLPQHDKTDGGYPEQNFHVTASNGNGHTNGLTKRNTNNKKA